MPKTFRWYYGTREGGLHAAETNRRIHGDDFYRNIGRTGGLISRGGGFAAMPKEKVRAAGRKGGSASHRGPDIKPRKRSVNKQPVEEQPVEEQPRKRWHWPWSK